MSRREIRSNGNNTKIDSALSHNLKGEVSREDCKRIILHSDKISFLQIYQTNLWYFAQEVKENEEGERTNTIIRMGRKASTYRSSECHPV